MSIKRNITMKKIYLTTILHYYLRVFISLGILLFSVNAAALTCPGPQDFVHDTTNTLWGWSWGLRSNRLADFTSPYHSWTWYSPYDQDFLSDYPLKAGIYFLNTIADGVEEARFYCEYELAGGELMEVHTPEIKHFSKEEFTRIKNTWERRLRDFGGGETSYTKLGYECSTTAGTADKCSVNFLL
jgi:hypothetical protein